MEFKQAGLYEETVKVLGKCKKPSQLLSFHKAAMTGRPAGDAAMDYGFPNRLEGNPALSGRNDWRAEYLLGCLYYDRLNYAAGAGAWEKLLRMNPENPYALPNLAFACYDHLGKKDRAVPLMRKAFSLYSGNSRLSTSFFSWKPFGLDAEKTDRIDAYLLTAWRKKVRATIRNPPRLSGSCRNWTLSIPDWISSTSWACYKRSSAD